MTSRFRDSRMSDTSSATSKFSSAVWVLATAGPVALGICALLLALGVPAVRDCFWEVEPLTAAEAAAVKDVARLRVLIEDGQSPTVKSSVRPGILGNETVEMTPLEAAAAVRDNDAIALLSDPT